MAKQLVHRAAALGSTLRAVQLVVPATAPAQCQDAESLLRAAGLPNEVDVTCVVGHGKYTPSTGVDIYLLTGS